jgi:predicted phage terminase large subunit-like protein
MSTSGSSPSLLASIARRQLDRILKAKLATGQRNDPAKLSLLKFIPLISPRYSEPYHLAPLLDALQRTETEAVRALVSVPPRFAKTETLLHYIAYRLLRRPWETIAYVTYADRLAKTKSRLARIYAQRAGIQLRDDASALNEWRNADLGGAIFTSVGGALIGQGCNVLIIDDPHAGRAAAESTLEREAVWDWYQGVGAMRVEPGGSIVITHTRWHPEDLTGHAIRDHAHENWELIKLPALNERGESLWPERWSAAALESKRLTAGEYEWASQFMGEPRPRGDSVFRGCVFYDKLPDRFQIGKGIDLASTAKTRADWSCGVILLRADDERGEPLYYVADVQRAQVEVPTFVRTMDAMSVSWPGTWHWYTSTTEKGTAQLLTSIGTYVEHELASADKFQRAGPVAAAWNAGRVLVPRQAPWLKAFVDELGAFIGKGDRHDDQVDALASAFGTLAGTAGKPRTVTGSGSRWGDEARGFG